MSTRLVNEVVVILLYRVNSEVLMLGDLRLFGPSLGYVLNND